MNIVFIFNEVFNLIATPHYLQNIVCTINTISTWLYEQPLAHEIMKWLLKSTFRFIYKQIKKDRISFIRPRKDKKRKTPIKGSGILRRSMDR